MPSYDNVPIEEPLAIVVPTTEPSFGEAEPLVVKAHLTFTEVAFALSINASIKTKTNIGNKIVRALAFGSASLTNFKYTGEYVFIAFICYRCYVCSLFVVYSC